MSLQVWLPLDKDLKNVGTKNITATKNSSSVVIQNDTDFGNVLYFGAASTNGCIYFPPEEFTGNTAMSVSFYVNFLTFDADYSNLVGFFNSATASDIYDANKIFSFYKHVSTSGTTAQFRFFVSVSTSNYIITNSFGTNTWQHFVLVNKGKNLILYQNGVKINEITVSSNLPYNLIKRVTFGQSNSSNNTRHCNAKISDLRIYDHALSEYDVQRIYQNRNTHEIPTVPGSPTPDLPLWVKILHHNVPSSNLFTTANAKKNTTENLYSRLGIYFNSTIFKSPYGKYEFLAKEKLESGSTEQSYQWRQTSSPTASTIAGFEKIKNTNNSQRLLGLKNNNAYATFHNGSSWWCACGSYTAYQGGIPGFGDIVKSGYLDLYAKARIGHLPKSYENEYEELEYIEGTGTQWIDAGVKANQDTKAEIKFEITGNATGYGAVFGSRTSYNNNAFNVWSKCGNGNIGANYCKAGAINSTIAQATNVTYYITLEKNKLSVNGNVTTFAQNTNFTTPGNIYLFNIYGGDAISTGTSNRILIGKVYSFKLYNSDIIIRNMIPSKRKSDNVIGMYDLVSKNFFTNQGTGVFDAGPSVISLPKEYEKLEYIESDGAQFIDTEIKPCMNKIRCICDMSPLNNADTPFFGSRGTYYMFYLVSGNYFWPTSKCETIQGTLAIGEKYHLDWNKGTLIVTGPNGVYQKGVRSNNTQDTYNMYIFNFNPKDSSRTCVAKLYNFKIYFDDLLVRCFIPAKRKSDNVIGLYDTVSCRFFTNSGTGSFTGA